MAVDPNRAKVQILYLSDDTHSYALGTTQNHATANGGISAGNNPTYPQAWTPRCVYGISADKLQKARLVIPDATDALFTTPGGSFTIPGTGTFTVTGAVGEKRPREAPNAS